MTPHNEAKKEEIAKVVLMPGDPLRAKYIAENFMQEVKLVNKIRGMYAYTGKYKGKEITVMAHGMGIPSIGIYTYELFKFYDVDTIIRIGSCGSYTKDLNVKDIVIVEKAYSESTYAEIQNGSKEKILEASKDINDRIENVAKGLDIKTNKVTVHSSDVFYSDIVVADKMYKDNNCSVVEMESFALFHNAKVLGKKSACLLTVSDSLVSKEEMSPLERQTALNEMITLGLETAITLV